MDINGITEKDLAQMVATVAVLLGGNELASLDSATRAAFLAALGTLPDTYVDLGNAQAAAEGEKMAATSAKNEVGLLLADIMKQIRDMMKSKRAPKKEYDLCLFDYPSETRVGTYQAQTPTHLSGAGFSNGVNTLRFKGNNTYGLVVYEIWRREGDDGQWAQHSLTKKQTFTEQGVTPGQYYEYRVRAVAAKTVSAFSNSAVIYGVL